MAPPIIDPARTWVISDTHFGHKNIIGFCHRPTDFENLIMEEWARAVPREDSTLLHLGDLAWKSNAQFKHQISKYLTGERKLIILGNHDKQRFSFFRESGFKIVKPFDIEYGVTRDWREGGERPYTVSFSHYPITGQLEPWHIHLHGHIHNNGYGGKGGPFIPFAQNQINLSVEQTKYKPVNLKELLDAYLYGKAVTG